MITDERFQELVKLMKSDPDTVSAADLRAAQSYAQDLSREMLHRAYEIIESAYDCQEWVERFGTQRTDETYELFYGFCEDLPELDK